MLMNGASVSFRTHASRADDIFVIDSMAAVLTRG